MCKRKRKRKKEKAPMGGTAWKRLDSQAAAESGESSCSKN